MTTTRITRPLSHWLPDIASRESVPVSWLSTLHQRIKTEVPDAEESTCVVRGLHIATASWDHTLSDVEQLQATIAEMLAKAAQIKALLPMEQLQATIAEMQAKAAQIKALLPIEGGVSPAQADKMREILK